MFVARLDSRELEILEGKVLRATAELVHYILCWGNACYAFLEKIFKPLSSNDLGKDQKKVKLSGNNKKQERKVLILEVVSNMFTSLPDHWKNATKLAATFEDVLELAANSRNDF